MLQLCIISSACLLSLSWLVGTHYLPWVSWHSEAAAFLAVLLAGWGCCARLIAKRDRHYVAFPVATLPLVAMAIVVGLQAAVGLVPFWGDAWTFCFYAALCVICLILGSSAASQLSRPGKLMDPIAVLACAIVVGASVSVFIAFCQVFSLWEQLDWIARLDKLRRPGGNMGQPNHLATLLVMGIASLVFLHHAKKLGTAACGAVLLLLGAGLALTESRSGLLSVILLLSWWLLKHRAIGNTTPRYVGIVFGLVLVGMFWAWPHLLNAMNLLNQHADGRMLEGSLRLEVWPQLLRGLIASPWIGWGFHQVAAAHNSVASAYAVSEPYSYSHNLVLDMAIWFGVPATLLLTGAAVFWIWRRARDANHLLPWYGLAVATPMVLHGLLEFPHAYAYFLAPVMFSLGAVEASTGVKPLVRVGIKSVVAVLLLVSAAMSLSVVEYLKIEEDFRAARFQALRIGSDRPADQRPRVLLYSQLGTLLDATRTMPAPGMSPGAMLVLKQAALHYPWSATQYRYAVALALNGEAAEAARQLRVMRVMWGEMVYAGVQRQIAELATTRYPELSALAWPRDE